MRAENMNSYEKETKKNGAAALPMVVDNEPTEEESDRCFDDMLSRIWPSFIDWAATEDPDSEFPVIHVTDRDLDIEVRAVLPGVDIADLYVSVSARTITIRGIRRKESLEQQRSFNSGRTGSEFKRTVPLPAHVSFLPDHAGNGRVTASLKEEILTVILPKNKQCLSQSLEISNENA